MISSGLGDHAILDRQSRLRKGQKIREILARRRSLANLYLLDVGTGSGHIASVFLDEVGPVGQVCGVDRCNRLAASGINFRLAETTDIPFETGRFDVVISNHVIEHVGGENEQRHHLSEIYRVLKPDGLVYLAVPNRWALWEHHFDLPFLSWFPRPVASWLIRVTGKGPQYDCRPLSRSQLQHLFSGAGLSLEDITIEALRSMAEIEMRRPLRAVVRLCPDFVLRLLLWVSPTLVVLGRRDSGEAV
ncbi:class I SAM-dependent methyltransferase [Roseibium sp. M-1]